MNDILFTATSICFFIWLLRNNFYWLHLWQIKEYRLDRLTVHLRETQQGKDLLIGVFNILKIILFVVYFFAVFASYNVPFLESVTFVVYLFSTGLIVKEVFERKFKIPVFTVKIFVILILTFLIQLVLYIFPLVDKFFWLLFIDKISVFIIAIFMGIFALPSEFYKDYFIQKATQKRKQFKDLTVIGITGSYGKGSTKEFIYNILSYKYKIEKTFGTQNTPIGIARAILNKINQDTKFFVAEMGAYKIGEIEEMCAIAVPHIGILTAVNDQHISLFGSIENTIRAKYEIMQNIPKDGLRFFNGNNKYSYMLYKRTTKKKVLYFADYTNENKISADIRAYNISTHPFYLEFDVDIKTNRKVKKIKKLHINSVGKQAIETILPAIYLANVYDFSVTELKEALKILKPLNKTMEPKLLKNGAVVIDDTFNANPASVVAAVEYMKIYKGKKILVLQPMIELGKNAEENHFELSTLIGKTCTMLILTNDNYLASIQKGIKKASSRCDILRLPTSQIADFIRSNTKKGDVVVFEGKETVGVLSLLPYEKIN